jgi:tetratricopeptide (TPR) repeat protein
VLLRLNNLPDAYAAIQQALTLEPDDTHMLLLSGHILVRRGDYIGAIADYTQVLELDPDNVAAIVGLGNVRMLSADYAGALKDYERAYRLDPNSAAILYNLAAAEARLGRCPQAVELLRRAVAREPALLPEAAQDDDFADCRANPAFTRLLRDGATPAAPAKSPGHPAAAPRPAKPGRAPRGQRR